MQLFSNLRTPSEWSVASNFDPNKVKKLLNLYIIRDKKYPTYTFNAESTSFAASTTSHWSWYRTFISPTARAEHALKLSCKETGIFYSFSRAQSGRTKAHLRCFWTKGWNGHEIYSKTSPSRVSRWRWGLAVWTSCKLTRLYKKKDITASFSFYFTKWTYRRFVCVAFGQGVFQLKINE